MGTLEEATKEQKARVVQANRNGNYWAGGTAADVDVGTEGGSTSIMSIASSTGAAGGELVRSTICSVVFLVDVDALVAVMGADGVESGLEVGRVEATLSFD